MTRFGDVLTQSETMEEVSVTLPKTLKSLNEVPIGVYVVGNVGLLSLVVGFAIISLRRAKQKSKG